MQVKQEQIKISQSATQTIGGKDHKTGPQITS